MRFVRNNISDLSPLVANTGLGDGDELEIQRNPLSYTSINTHIPALQSRGVTVEFDDTTHLNQGEPRMVRMIYFLPNDRLYQAEVVQRMKDEIRTVQTFFAEQMESHGYGRRTFRVETDLQGEPKVHSVGGQHPFNHYDNTLGWAVFRELERAFDFNANIYFIVLGTDALRQGYNLPDVEGVGRRWSKNGGWMLVPNEFSWSLVAHELGHVFGLNHDFRASEYIMSYGPGQDRLSACHAEYLSMHPYFNPDTPIEEGPPPTIERISPPTYPAGSQNVTIRFQVNASEGLHQVLLFAGGLNACRGLEGEKAAVVEFDYNGSIDLRGFTNLSSTINHPMTVKVVDTEGNESDTFFILTEFSPHHIVTLSGHTDVVRSLSFSPDGTILASGGHDGTVKLWDVVTKQIIGTLIHGPHGVFVFSASFSPDGTILASGGYDGTVKLWDVATRQIISTLTHGGFVYSVSFSPDGTILASGGRDGTVKLWNVATRRIISTLTHGDFVDSVSFSPDGTILASGGHDGTVKLWDVATQTNY